MICDRARHLFGACWDDELTHAERDWLETHFASCSRCRADYDGFSRVLELTGALPRAEASPDLVDRVLARTRRASTAPDAVGAEGMRWVPAAAAAAAAVLTVAGALLFLPGSPWRAPGAPVAVQVRVTSGPAEPVLLHPADAKRSERQGSRTSAGADLANDVFDHSEDVEFILDPVTLHRGRAVVPRTGSWRRGVEGGQPIISF
jgi:hypothetical protein